MADAVAQSLPTGGSVAAGSAIINQPNASSLTVTQSSQNAVANWQSFSVGQGNSVTFVQPNGSSAILNRVTGSATSNIAGSITANGQVYLVNPNGIAITRSGTVNAGGGFVASTLGISDSDFMAGKRTFTGNGASAGVSNAGAIRVGRGGYSALIGGTVSNSGSIDVPLGKVGLGSGERATLDFSGDGFLQVAVPTVAGGKGALIKNSGTIRADGGSVILSAATAREAARNAINISGTIQARSIGGRSGSIVIGGGAGGRVRIIGRLIATSRVTTGGRIAVTGQSIRLKGATINASGKTGGGTINIGGNYQGKGPLQRAETVTIDKATTIKADATQTGNGGNVVVWSDLLTTFAGTISAKGGALSGYGGDAEVSGKAKLAYTGTTILTAANGSFGNLLLDPYNVIISNGTNNTGGSFDANVNDSVINAATLNNALASANVTITTGSSGAQIGSITVNAPVSWSSGTMLTLTAANAIAVNAPITITGGGQLALNTATTMIGSSTQPLLSFGGGASVNFASGQSGQALTINTNSYTLVYTMAQLDAIDGKEAVGNTTVTPYGAGLGGRYALAGDLNATGTTYADAIVAGQNGYPSFSGTLEGLGHAVSNLTINSAYLAIGLIGTLDSGGMVRDLGVAGGSISGNTGAGGSTGGLVGFNSGTIAQSYAMGTVSNGRYIGGLVGVNSSGSTITQSYATGTIGNNGVQNVGGLVGFNGGTITQSYATGAVSGVAGVGGLVGSNYGTIALSYATGAVSVSGQGSVGGLVGYNQGGNPGQSYYDTQTSGQSTSNGGTGVTTAQLAGATVLAALNSNGVVFGNAGNKTTPYLLTNTGPVFLATDTAAAPTAPTFFYPILTQASLEAVNNNTSRNYVLANNLDLGGTTYTNAVITIYSGALEGLGNIISNLTINAPNTNNVGLIGTLNNGTVRNIGVVSGIISGRDNVGGLVGSKIGGSITQAYSTAAVLGSGNDVGGLVGANSGGSIAQAYATGSVSGPGNDVGGLVGFNNGSITQVYATGAVSGSGNDVGGLVGFNNSGASVTQAYATGAVSGLSRIGGFVGDNSGSITQAYATGAVSGSSFDVGGFAGYGSGTGITQAYWDTQTSGQANGAGSGSASGITGLTTAQLQSNYTGFMSQLGNAFAGGVGGLYPYLTAFFPNGVQAVSGFAYSDAGLTGRANTNVTVLNNGATFGNVSTGANGYYYAFGAAGSIPNGNSILSFTNNSATLTTSAYDATNATTRAATAAQGGVNLYGNALTVPTNQTQLSLAPSLATAQSLATVAAGGNTTALAAINGATGRGFIATGSSFTIDTPVPNLTNTLVVQTSANGAGITVSNPIVINSGGSLGLNAVGALTINGNITVNGAAGVALNAGFDTTTVPGTSLLQLSFAQGSALTFNDASGNAITSAANGVGRLAINGNPYTLIYAMADLDGIDSVAATNGPITNQTAAGGLSGRYAFARNLFATSDGTATGTPTAYTDSLITGQNNVTFAGTLDGLGHTISNLTIASSNNNVGLIGTLNSSGTVRDVGAVGGSVSGGAWVGGLVGYNIGGSITQVYATGAVNGILVVGGLVGSNNGGSITQAYATGAVSGGNQTGGLVGANSGGSITQAYATGAVSGSSLVGGLVGNNSGSSTGSLTQVYATGAVSGSSLVGGLVGINGGGSITQAYWDTQTSGQPVTGVGDGGSTGVTGLTTRQLQGLDPISGSGNSAVFFSTAANLGSNGTSAFGGGTNGLYPYLTNFAPFGVQAFTSTAYSDAGITALASNANGAVSVNLIANGIPVGSATTGANGYYYIATPLPAPFTPAVTNGSNLLAYNSATNAARLVTASGGALQIGLNIYGNTLAVETGATLFSNAPQSAAAVRADSSYAANLVSAAGGNANAIAAYTNAAGLGLIATDPTAGFTVDRTPTINTSFVVETCFCAPLTVSAPINVASGQSLGLLSGGALNINTNITVNGAGGGVALAYDASSTTNLSFGLTGSGFTGGLTYRDGSGAAITSSANSAGGKLAINGNPYTLIYSMAEIDGIDGVAASSNAIVTQANGLAGNYALAGNLSAASTAYTAAIVGGQGGAFSGVLDGLGHTISNLTINGGTGSIVGFVGTNTGTLRDIGLVGGSVSGHDRVGGLVGVNSGTIQSSYTSLAILGVRDPGDTVGLGGLVGVNTGSGTIQASYATGAVTSNGVEAGGLVGYNVGNIQSSYATGAVSGLEELGGLAGDNQYGTIQSSYATGAVSGTNFIGGLIGVIYSGTVQTSYATGRVSGSGSNVGGVVGLQQGTITSTYWDTLTSGQSIGIGGANASQTGVTGQTTAQLQGTLPGGFSTAAWGAGTGLYPYLKTFFPNGVTAVSGFAYTDAGATLAASGANGAVNVSVLGNGTLFGTVSTGANGYYYVFGSAASVANGASLLAYTQVNNATGAKDAATYTVATADPNNAGVNVYGGWKLDRPASTVASLSALNAFETSAAGASPAAAFTLANRDIRIAASTFDLDGLVALTGTLALNSTGAVTQSAGTIAAGALSLTGTGGSYTLTQSGNAVDTIVANAGSVAFVDSSALSTGTQTSTGNASTAGVTTTGNVSLVTSANLTLAAGAPVSGASPVLSTGGAFINNAGASGVVASTGRFLVWSQNPANDTVGGLSYAFKQYNAPFGTAPAATGNGLLYTLAPTAVLGAAGSFDKTYDKSATTRLLTSAGLYLTSGGIAGDVVTARAGTTGTFNSVNVGTNIPVSIDSSALTFADAAGRPVYGYQITSGITGNITPKLLSINLSVQNKVYDANGTANFVLSSADVVAGDTVTFTPLQAPVFGNRNVGTYTLQATNITLGGANAANYAPSNSGAAANASITRRLLTITADAQSRVYGEANPTLTYTIGGMGLANGDARTGALATTATSASGAGVYAITKGTVAQTGSFFTSSNYTITFIGNNLTVTPRALTVSANAQTRVYGDANPALTYQTAGLVNGDTLAGSLATSAKVNSNVGSYGITQGTLTASTNYAISFTGTNLTVMPASVILTALGGTSVEGTPPLNPGLSATGLRNNEGIAVLTGLSNSFGITSTTSAAGGPYTLNGVGTLTNPNYLVAQRIAGLWIVTAASVAPPSVAPVIDLASIASTIANDNFYPAALPNDAAPVFGAAPILTSLGTGILYADPRFDSGYVCFGGGFGTAPSCYATGR